MSWWQQGPEEVGSRKKGIEALGIPCLSRYFGIDCALCEKARAYYNKGDDGMGSQFYAKKTPLVLAYLFCEHEAMEEWNKKLVVISLPIRQVVEKMATKLKEGDWQEDPFSLDKGFLVIIERKKVEGERFPVWYLKRGKELPINREKLLDTYKKLGVIAPTTDNIGAFMDWIYNKHPELVVVSGADIPYNTPVSLRLLPWPVEVDGELKLEPEVNPKASPVKVLRFHRAGDDDTFMSLKEVGFDKTKLQQEREVESFAAEEDDIPF